MRDKDGIHLVYVPGGGRGGGERGGGEGGCYSQQYTYMWDAVRVSRKRSEIGEGPGRQRGDVQQFVVA